MKVLCFIFLVVSMQFGQAQKVVEKTIFDTIDTAIEIDASNCYAVFVTTSKSNKVIVAAKMAGEYSDNLSLNIHEEGSALLIDTGFNLNFEAPNDKLSAHKVVSISLHVSVPEHLRVRIFGTYSNIDVSGFYRNLDVSLNDGNCTLRNTGVDTNVQTQSGTITVVADSGTITAKTKYGRLSSEEIKSGSDVYNLKSVTGNIHLKKLN
ncbi:hypothetical protein NQT66_12105 [Cellulophaga baltica]|uniref:hypothetical protein n=1 Tax=Cellulophaga baltica TaxID=76594 RepID=UPI0021492547|nr:hypothetical protein [Cellulophaga baltica]MCR1025555.1 hypothetical protein [Cellulophaga baltica]